MISTLLSFAGRLAAHKRGNVLMIFAFAVIPMVFATGMGIDYARPGCGPSSTQSPMPRHSPQSPSRR